MMKKEFLIPTTIILLTAVFGIISVVVFITNGKSAFWLSKKMKIGALLLTLSVTSCGRFKKPVVMCYAMPAPNSIYVNELEDDYRTIKISLDTSNILTGNIYVRTSDDFSFVIKDTLENYYQKDAILPLDGKFNDDSENFKIELDKNLKPGVYLIQIFDTKMNELDSAISIQQYDLEIKN